jgi:hypothetical protein
VRDSLYMGRGLLCGSGGWPLGGVSAIGKISILGWGMLHEAAVPRESSIGEPLW